MNTPVNHKACFGPVSIHSSHKGLDAIFRQQADQRRSAIAVIYGPQALSYAELDRRADLLAAHLTKRGIQHEEPVGILLKMSLDQIVCQLAIIRAGGSCLPLDPDAPDERIEFMLWDVGTRLVLTAAALQSRLPAFECILMEDQQAGFAFNTQDTVPQIGLSSEDHRTHIIFTSGTTGQPKAVQLLARGIIRLTVSPHYVTLGPQERIAAICNPTFDVSLLEVWGALLNGGTAVILPKQTVIDPYALRDSLRAQHITTVATTTALFNQTVHACPDAFGGLHQLSVGGEAPNLRALRRVFEASPPKRLLNAYGPTECTTISLCHQVTWKDIENESVPIGKPIDNTQVFVLDEALRPLGENEVGEIYIGGDGVARGYWNRPELNAERFINVDNLVEGCTVQLYKTGDLGSWQAGGVLHFHGRNDNQVKIRGHRIEIEEIEAVMRASSMVRDAAVTVQQTELEDKYLVGFVVLHKALPVGDAPQESLIEQETQQILEQVGRYLESQLPVYMRPRLISVQSLPINANGKIDRQALARQWHNAKASEKVPILDSQVKHSHAYDELSDTEAALGAMWRRTLDIHSIGRHDNFFMLGGNSLQAASLALQVGKHLNHPFPVQALYNYPTLSELAHYIDNRHQVNDGFTTVDDISILLADLYLPDHIQPLSKAVQPWRSMDRGRVFITGTTGFLGAFVLHDLLRLPEVKQVACLVRANDDDKARVRIRNNMSLYGLWDDAFSERLVPLPGDLSQNNLGLEPARFDEWSKTSDVVFHLGAHVNYIQPYSAHKAANVTGTINVLNFVTSGRPKALHYMSTIATFGPANLLKPTDVVYEGDDMTTYLTGLKYETGYSQSQWVAEQLVWEAQRRGVPVSVYRPGFIMGHSQTGAGNPKDFVARLIRGCIALGAYPLLPGQGKQFVPVDYVSQVLLKIASDDANLTHAYHLVPPRNDMLWELFDLLDRCGYPLEALPLFTVGSTS
ncbi:amino acid adenylation domain-containing SDR family oxidoreductase [Mycetohabitans endofungorum]|uniref:amino acid adenylation domain-containing SDR family oxidoreductase n=1 Tax=Mycetohabitans endofungorum TaxID=417203 RepID=UPI002B061F76|nr:amino acid adenylation domain-containing SDR family oxidoreductase [Mycetohabitans endofungorum]